MTEERWLPIPDWEGLYSVSNHGRVRSEPQFVWRTTTARGYGVSGRVLRPNAKGCVNLSQPGARRSVLCHSLAAYVFGCAPANIDQSPANSSKLDTDDLPPQQTPANSNGWSP
jgi:hypothetical protein